MAELQEIKEQLDEISPTFCVAKWKQVTMHLESGLTHSCHHPKAHKVDLNELKYNHTALHNTAYKKKMRKLMLEGESVRECEYCNRVERGSSGKGKGGSYSDRIYKSKDSWAWKYIPEILETPWDANVFPSYFEVSFSSACNCSCMYCSPTFSSSWSKHIEEFGQYKTSRSTRSFYDAPAPEYLGKTDNPYLKAFWKWWPELYKNLEIFRVTGGEPLLSKDTFKILDYLIENPRPELQFDVNSNLCINHSIFSKFLDKFKQIANTNEKISIYTSCEAYGEKANYIRHGFDYDYWLSNCRMMLQEIDTLKLSVMCTYNILSITSFTEFLKDILELKREFPLRVTIDIPYLMNPAYFQPDIITKDFMRYIQDSVTYMYCNPDIPQWPPLSGTAFWDFEITKMRRVFNLVNGKPENSGVIDNRKDFIIFIDEYDKRYGTDFLKTFPEYREFYFHCKEL